jgi:Transposase IS66 family
VCSVSGTHSREFPELPLDNNTSERALRGPVVGRKNFYGSGSKTSAELASRVWTITPPPPNAPASTRWSTCAPTSTNAPKPAANRPPAWPWTDSCPGRSTPTTAPPGAATPTRPPRHHHRRRSPEHVPARRLTRRPTTADPTPAGITPPAEPTGTPNTYVRVASGAASVGEGDGRDGVADLSGHN